MKTATMTSSIVQENREAAFGLLFCCFLLKKRSKMTRKRPKNAKNRCFIKLYLIFFEM